MGPKMRAKNFSYAEEKLFTEVLLQKFKDVIENKRTDASTREEKAAAWRQLTNEFNAVSNFCFRTEENLRNLWDRLKKNARKAKATERRETFATGGGQRNGLEPTQIDLRVLEVLGPSGVGLINHFDGDADTVDSSGAGTFDVFISNESMTCNNETSTADNVVPKIQSIDFGGIVVPESSQPVETNPRTSCNVVPRMLYSKKPDAIRSCPESASNSGSELIHAVTTSLSGSSQDTSSSSHEIVRKRTISEELEWAKQCKRRRPVVQDDYQVKLTLAKLELTQVTKARMEEENKRNQELFEIEKRRKKCEAELAMLHVLKMKRDLNLE